MDAGVERPELLRFDYSPLDAATVNYLLPTDIDIPRTEVDIQFAGLKVDDLVSSTGSNTKIVFLDACRDNPVLFKNLVKGRGSSPTGLAPPPQQILTKSLVAAYLLPAPPMPAPLRTMVMENTVLSLRP